MLNVHVTRWPGYVGGCALAHLIQHSKWAEYEITIHLRSTEKARAFEKLGFKTVIGSLDDVVDLEKLVAQSDIIFQIVSSSTPVMGRRPTRRIWDLQANSDHLEGTNAILRGLKTRYQQTGVAPILIHTVSATSKDGTHGEPHTVPLRFLVWHRYLEGQCRGEIREY